jgi:hypothetical protein
MATTHGRAGRTLGRKLLAMVSVLVVVGVAAYLLTRHFVPLLAPIAPLIGVFVVMKILQDRGIRKDFHAVGRGFVGEVRIGELLEGLPAPWRVFHDVDLGGENADHVVVGTVGVFNVEVKNFSGKVSAKSGGLYAHGKRNDKVVRQAHRQAHALRERLGADVTPLLVFAGGALLGDQVGNLKVFGPKELVPYLLSLKERKLEYSQAREVFARLEPMIRK